jgi:hypothetical protein
MTEQKPTFTEKVSDVTLKAKEKVVQLADRMGTMIISETEVSSDQTKNLQNQSKQMEPMHAQEDAELCKKAERQEASLETTPGVVDKTKEALVGGVTKVKEVVTGVGSKVKDKASEYVHHASAALKKSAAMGRAKKAHYLHEEADKLQEEARSLYSETMHHEIGDLKKKLETLLEELKGLENRVSNETSLLNQTYEKEKKENQES